jgi:hypothetical protein
MRELVAWHEDIRVSVCEWAQPSSCPEVPHIPWARANSKWLVWMLTACLIWISLTECLLFLGSFRMPRLILWRKKSCFLIVYVFFSLFSCVILTLITSRGPPQFGLTRLHTYSRKKIQGCIMNGRTFQVKKWSRPYTISDQLENICRILYSLSDRRKNEWWKVICHIKFSSVIPGEMTCVYEDSSSSWSTSNLRKLWWYHITL